MIRCMFPRRQRATTVATPLQRGSARVSCPARLEFRPPIAPPTPARRRRCPPTVPPPSPRLEALPSLGAF